MATTLISIYSIFIVFFVSSAIKNLVVNANGYSRYLRILIFLVVLGYLTYVGFLTVRPIMNVEESAGGSIEDTLSIVAFFIMTIVSLGTLIVMDFKKASVRDTGKYRAKVFINFKTDKPKDCGKLAFKSIVLLAMLSVLVLSIVIIHFSGQGYSYAAMALLITHVVFNYLLLGLKRSELLNKNARYNLLKNIVLNINQLDGSDLPTETKIQIGRKMMSLYHQLFTTSGFYKRKQETNNAILYEIYERTGYIPDVTKGYFKDPVTKKPISLAEYQTR